MTNPDNDIERFELLRTAEALQQLAPELRALIDEPDLLGGLELPQYARAELRPDEAERPTPIRHDMPNTSDA
ncbi:MAG: hypothetical protein DWI48_07115 [Chloroflexi bacterium]|nr:MAG: hypothetical protein DWI48_07115 [Chloroflexota bacterium]